MTELLEQAMSDDKPLCVYARVKQLPETEQDVIATLILEELEDEALWDSAFAKSHDALAKLAAAALAEDQAGETQERDRRIEDVH